MGRLGLALVLVGILLFLPHLNPGGAEPVRSDPVVAVPLSTQTTDIREWPWANVYGAIKTGSDHTVVQIALAQRPPIPIGEGTLLRVYSEKMTPESAIWEPAQIGQGIHDACNLEGRNLVSGSESILSLNSEGMLSTPIVILGPLTSACRTELGLQ